MKKKTLLGTVVLLFAFGTLISQNVDRQYVLLEKFTGTWCSPCAAMVPDLEKALDEGYDYAVVEYHQGGDIFKNNFADVRAIYYDVKSYPTLVFDGEYVSMTGKDYYETIVEYHKKRMAVKSPLLIELDRVQGESIHDWTFNVTVDRKNADFTNVDNIKLYATVVESDIRYQWFTHDRLEHVERVAVSNVDGDPISFTNNTYKKQFSIQLDNSIQVGNCDIVVFVQDATTKEVLQAYKSKLMDGEMVLNAPSVVKTEQLPGTQSVMIEWTAPENKNEAKLLGYNVYSKTNQKLNQLGLLSSTSFITKTVKVGGEQCYYATAVYDLLESVNSNQGCTPLRLLTEPKAFDTLSRGNAGNTITLKWEAPEGYGIGSGKEKYVVGYDVYRNSKKVNETVIADVTFKDIVSQIGKYAYNVVAVYHNDLVEPNIESPKTTPIIVDVKTLNPISVDSVEEDVNIYLSNGIINISGTYDTLSIYDASGKLITVSRGESSIDISAFAGGLYIIKAYSHGAVKTTKIIK